MSSATLARTSQVSAGAILFSALIGIGVLITFGALAGGIVTSTDPGGEPLSQGMFGLIAVLCVIMLVSGFFVAGFVASKVSHQPLRFDSVAHSLGTWAVMAIVLVLLVSMAAVVNGIQDDFRNRGLPSLLTDVEVLKGQAVTTVQPGHDPKRPATQADKAGDKFLASAWWISFVSLLCGSGASVSGGLLGRRKPSAGD